MSPSTSQANGVEYSVVIVDVNSMTVRSRHSIPEGTILVPRLLSPPNTFAWSSDNRYLLISWEKAVVLDLDQRRVIPISTQPVVAAWMPGAAAILYFDIANWEKRNEREFGGLYLRRLDSPDRTVIADAQVLFNEGVMLHDAMHHGLLVLSPSRSKMAMVSGTSDKRTSMLRIYDVAATAKLDLTKPAITTRSDDVIVALEWSPDERSMAALTIPRSATLPKGPFAQPAVATVNLTTRVPAWQTLTTMNFDLRQGWPDTPELLLLIKPLSWTR